ncbi:MAG: aspartate aminotransferase family protein [Hyphomicrobiales bacterium]|nr:aspartate aminotransferase family protein [Hyphomicrobiales bacterium]
MIPAVMPTYARADVVFERGEGPYLFDTGGRQYLDFAAGIAVNALGHSHPYLVKKLTEQVGKLWHCSNLYRIAGQEKLAARLVEHTFADSVFFCNSGAEAMECAFKMVRRYFDMNGQPGRYRIISLSGAFHGRTLATIAAGRQAKHLEGFDPIVDGFDQVPFGNLNELRAALSDETAAIVVEPVQGEGGIIPANLEYLRELRRVADEFGLLLVFDEIQTGIGRTGKLYAYEWAGVAPDILATAKGLANGVPIGACMATETVAKAMVPGTHGSTFGGNPLAMAAANAVLDVVLEDGFLDRVDAIAELVWRRLQGLAKFHPTVIEEIRGAGLMIGIKCKVPNTDLVNRLRAKGLLTVPAADNVVRLLPPLIIEEIHVNEALAILDRCCIELAETAEENG